MNFYRLFRALGMAAMLLVMTMPVHAAGAHSADAWQFDAAVYVWGASIDATPVGGDTIHISFSDLIDNLDFTLMGTLGARKGRWSLLADIIYLNVEDDQKGTTKLLDIIPVYADIDVELEAWVVTAAGGYNVIETDTYSLDLLAGARYFWLDIPIDFQDVVRGPVKRKASPSDHVTDGIIGVRGRADLTDKWYLSYYLDAGAGDSDYTWQGLAGVNYRFRSLDAGLGYRYLDWNVEGPEVDDVTLKGPYAGVKFLF